MIIIILLTKPTPVTYRTMQAQWCMHVTVIIVSSPEVQMIYNFPQGSPKIPSECQSCVVSSYYI